MTAAVEPLAILSYKDDVAVITLNEPTKLNAMSLAMVEVVHALLEQAKRSARAIILTGAGRAFCAGANLTMDFDPSSPDYDAGGLLETHFNPLMLTLHDLDLPLITVVNGAAAGIGCALALSGDLIIASDDSYFLLAFDRIGLVPDGGTTWLLPRAIGRSLAMEMMLLGDKLPAKTALEWGLVNRVVSHADLMDEALSVAHRLARGPTDVIGLVKRAARSALANGYAEQLQIERAAQRTAGRTANHREGISAFLQQRPAVFSAPVPVNRP